MVKLVGVIGDDDDKSNNGSDNKRRECTSRRHFPLEIEPELKMMVALDDSCLGCGPETGEDKPGHGLMSEQWSRDTEVFLKNYKRWDFLHLLCVVVYLINKLISA